MLLISQELIDKITEAQIKIAKEEFQRIRLEETKLKKEYRKKHEFYSSSEWLELRKIAIAKYGKRCMCCGSTRKINVDHIKSRHKYPESALDINNMQILCWPCNKRKSWHDETNYRDQYKEGIALLVEIIH